MKQKKIKKQFDPFENLVLDDDEKELEQSLEKSQLKSVNNLPRWNKELKQIATRTLELRKSKKITLRLNQGDLIKLKAKAKKYNIPYQTLLNVLVRNYVENSYQINL